MDEHIAILRRCRRCFEWLSIDCFSPLGKLCKECMSTRGDRPAQVGLAVMRGIVLTDKGREALREMERPAA